MKDAVDDWQKRHQMTNTALAELLHVHPSQITHIKKGRRKWSPRLAEAMEKLSGGEIHRLQLLYPNDKPAPSKNAITKILMNLLALFRRR